MSKFFLSIKNWILKYKKWLLIGLIVLMLAGLFYVYYLKWAKGYVMFSANTSDFKLTIEGKDYQIKNSKLISLKPGVYSISASKDGYMTYNNFLLIKPLHFSRQTIKLSDIFYLGSVANGDNSSGNGLIATGSFINYYQTAKSLVYYSADANAFYKIDLDKAQKTYQAPNTVGEKIIDINLDSSQEVGSVSYSSDGSKALVIVNSNDANIFKSVNFSDNSVQNLPDNIIDASWLSADQILVMTNDNPNQLIVLDSSLNQIKTAGNLSTPSFSFAFNNQKVLLTSLENDDKYILDLNSGQKTAINLAGSVIGFSASENQAIVKILTSDNKTKNYLLNQDGTSKELNLSVTGLVWYSLTQILYTQSEKDANYTDFMLYDLNSQKSSVIKTYFSSGASIDAIVFSPGNVFFISAGQIMGFKK